MFQMPEFRQNFIHWGFLLLLVLGMGMAQSPLAIAQAPAAGVDASENPYPGRFPAPSLDGGTEWLNCSGPISLKDVRGKIVLLDFWTYCCINCMHVLPDLKFLEQKYPDQLVVIGVHSAKFDNEKESENIREAIVRYEIEHPVVNDSNMTIARKYQFSSWPTFILLDPEGNYVGRQPGEGNRELFDKVIGDLVRFHRAKGTLDETPVKFNLEREKDPLRPLKYPGKILADTAGGRLFIADSNHNRIVVASLTGELIAVVGSGKLGAVDGDFEQASFDHPQGMSLVGETLYVADTENHLIRTINLGTRQVGTLAGTGFQSRVRVSGGKLRDVALNSPWDLEYLNGVLYIAMAGPHQLWKHVLGSETLELFAGNGREDIVDGSLEASSLAQPSCLDTDGTSLFFADSEGSAIRQLVKGQVTTIVGPHDLPRGRSLFEFGDIDGVGDDVRLQHPIGLAYHNGQLFVADTYNDKIKLVNINTRTAKSWLGTGERGDGLNPVQFNEPAGVAVAGEFLFVADTNNHRILKVNLETQAAEIFEISALAPPVSTTGEAPRELAEGAAEKLPPSVIQAGKELTFQIQFEFKDEYKLNKLAPVAYRLVSLTEQKIIDPSLLGKRTPAVSNGTAATISIPLTGAAGEGVFELSLAYQYCRDGVGGVCRFATEKWEIPVSALASESENVIKLKATP